MTMTLSKHALQTMGFHEFTESEAITASFSSITAYEVRGVTLPAGTAEISGGRVAGVDYKLAISISVNGACTALTGDVFTDDNEEDWKKENKCQGPFVLLLIGPTQEHKCTSGQIKVEKEGSVTTYDSFPDARKELALLELRVIAPVISGLTCVLNEDVRYVALRKITRTSFGHTSDGLMLHDIRFEMRAEMYTSYNLANPQLTQKLEFAKSLTEKLNPKASRFFALGLAEEDQLKRFLYFFLALEVETHAVFGQIDHAAALAKLLDGTAERPQSTTKLLEVQIERLTNLYDRFVWCATFVWPNLNDTDITQFKTLKGARDNIAHGTTSEPPLGFARQAELLAHKVLWSECKAQ
jgi:hypothetical protein